MLGYIESRIISSNVTDSESMILEFTIPTDSYSLIIPTEGTLGSFYINWGDGEIGESTSHTYALAGIYTIEISGIFGNFKFNNDSYCSILTKISNWGNIGITSLERAFYGCSNLVLEDFDIPLGIENFDYAFRGCILITEIHMPEDSYTLYSTFYNCTALEVVVLGSETTTISTSSFEGCSSLHTINIPDTITIIGFRAFLNCSSLINVTLPEGLTSLSIFSFAYTSIESIVIPSTIVRIPDSCFRTCASLQSVYLPSSITSLGDHAFRYCTSLEECIIDATTPPSMDSKYYIFESVPTTFEIKVPVSYLDTYKAASGWSYWATYITEQ
jgi:hypothetical protein